MFISNSMWRFILFLSDIFTGITLFLSNIITGNITTPFVSNKSKVKFFKLRDCDTIFTCKYAVSGSLELKDEKTFLSSNPVSGLVLGKVRKVISFPNPLALFSTTRELEILVKPPLIAKQDRNELWITWSPSIRILFCWLLDFALITSFPIMFLEIVKSSNAEETVEKFCNLLLIMKASDPFIIFSSNLLNFKWMETAAIPPETLLDVKRVW